MAESVSVLLVSIAAVLTAIDQISIVLTTKKLWKQTELIKARKESITGENENNDALDRLDQILKEVRDNAIKQETE